VHTGYILYPCVQFQCKLHTTHCSALCLRNEGRPTAAGDTSQQPSGQGPVLARQIFRSALPDQQSGCGTHSVYLFHLKFTCPLSLKILLLTIPIKSNSTQFACKEVSVESLQSHPHFKFLTLQAPSFHSFLRPPVSGPL
jgi:hypothetical protein